MLQVLSENPKLGTAFEQLIKDSPDVKSESLIIDSSNPIVLGDTIQTIQTQSDQQTLTTPTPEDAEIVPSVVIKELEAEPGCRSFSTTTCTKQPIGKTWQN